METNKKSWQKPELTVLVRNTPEESVLGFCKNEANPIGLVSLNGACVQHLSDICGTYECLPGCNCGCNTEVQS